MKEIWTTMASMMGVWAFCQSLLQTVFPGFLSEPSANSLPVGAPVCLPQVLLPPSQLDLSYCYYDITEIDGVNTNELYNVVQLYLTPSPSASPTMTASWIPTMAQPSNGNTLSVKDNPKRFLGNRCLKRKEASLLESRKRTDRL
ncbi:AAA+-type ATPase [Forsythia ovata]|uniref:AAA+-type ATPase n=1 Tax=Forsythia ovata TaxID=205694 RepID=A0ABD1WZR6_9LAMI